MLLKVLNRRTKKRLIQNNTQQQIKNYLNQGGVLPQVK